MHEKIKYSIKIFLKQLKIKDYDFDNKNVFKTIEN